MTKQRLIRGLVALVAVGCFLFIGRKYLGQLDLITQAHWSGIVTMAVVHLLTLWLQGLTIKWGLDSCERSITERESFALFVISSYANLFVPRSGVGTTAVYLNRARNISISDFSSIVLFNAALFVFSCSLTGCLLCGIDWIFRQQVPAWWMVALLPAAAVTSWIAVSIKWHLPNWYRGPGRSTVSRLDHARIQLFRSENMFRLSLAHFVLVLLRALRLYIAFWVLGIEATFSAVLLTSVLSDLAFVIAVTPGAIGFREAAIALLASKLGISVSTAISVAIFDRLVFSLTVVIVAQLMIAFVLGRHRNGLAESSPPRGGNELVS